MRPTGQIITVPGDQLLDSDYFTLDDGLNPPVLFGFDKDSVPRASRTTVAVSDLTSAEDVANVVLGVNDGRLVQVMTHL